MRDCLAIARPTGQLIGWLSPCGRLPREERLQVAIDRVTALPLPPGLHLTHRLMGVASDPEPVAVLAEVAVIERSQDLGNRLLNHSIQHRGDSEGPLVFHTGDLNPVWTAPMLGTHEARHDNRLPALHQMPLVPTTLNPVAECRSR